MATCAFCGRDRPLTQEHVFPRWLLAEFPKADPKAPRIQQLGAVDPDDPDVFRLRDLNRGASPVIVSAVCDRTRGSKDGCNGTWMSRLETDAKSRLLRLAAGDLQHLSAKDQRLVAFWAVKTMVMIEYTDHRTRVTSAAQRRALYSRRQSRRMLPSEQVRVFIGSLAKPAEEPYYLHRASQARLDNKVIGGYQLTAIVFGSLVLVVTSSSVPRTSFDLRPAWDLFDLRKRVAEMGKGTLRYPPRPLLDAAAVAMMADVSHALGTGRIDTETGEVEILPPPSQYFVE